MDLVSHVHFCTMQAIKTGRWESLGTKLFHVIKWIRPCVCVLKYKQAICHVSRKKMGTNALGREFTHSEILSRAVAVVR